MAVYAFTENDKREFNRLKKKLDSIKGPGVVNTPTSIYVAAPPTQRAGRRGGSPPSEAGIYIKITSYSVITGATNRWRYSWVEQEPVENGVWQDMPDGRSSPDDGYAYNGTEANNADTGVQGNGINIDSLPPGVNFLPVQGSPVKYATPMIDCNDVTFWHFNHENGVSNQSGLCE